MTNQTCHHFLVFFMLLFSISTIVANEVKAQHKQPKLAEFGTEPLHINADSYQKEVILEEEINEDSIFKVQLTSLSSFYQSARLIVSMTNNSSRHVDHLWFQLRLLTPKSEFLFREQPVMFTNVSPDQTVSYEVLCESITPNDIGYVVLRPELIELNRQEKTLDTSFFELNNATDFPLKLVLNTRFQ